MIRIHKKYKPLADLNTRYYILTGGRGSGKSFVVSTFLLTYLSTEKRKILFTRYTLTSAKDSIIPEFEEKIELLSNDPTNHFEVNQHDIKHKQTDSEIKFRGIKTSSGVQTAKLKSLSNISIWVLDEADELTNEKEFDKIDFSIRDKKNTNHVILIMNPSTKEHWIYQRFFLNAGVSDGFNGVKGNTTYIHSTYLDNIDNLSDSFLDRVNDLKINNTTKYNHIILGGWLNKAEGVIFNNWSFGDFDNTLSYDYGLDFGVIDPDALVKVAIDKKRKLIYIDELMYKSGQGTNDLFNNVKANTVKNKLIIADSAETRIIKDFKALGLNVKKTKKFDGSIMAGIKVLMEYEFVITKTSTNLANELNNYVWNDKKSDKPIDDYNHLIDAIRYVALENLHYKKNWLL